MKKDLEKSKKEELQIEDDIVEDDGEDEIKTRVEKRQSCRHSSLRVTWGLFFITIGSVLLAQKLGYVSEDVWNKVGTYWPALLIVGGIELLLGSNFLSFLIFVFVLLPLAAYFLFPDAQFFKNAQVQSTKQFVEQNIQREMKPQKSEMKKQFRQVR